MENLQAYLSALGPAFLPPPGEPYRAQLTADSTPTGRLRETLLGFVADCYAIGRRPGFGVVVGDVPEGFHAEANHGAELQERAVAINERSWERAREPVQPLAYNPRVVRAVLSVVGGDGAREGEDGAQIFHLNGEPDAFGREICGTSRRNPLVEPWAEALRARYGRCGMRHSAALYAAATGPEGTTAFVASAKAGTLYEVRKENGVLVPTLLFAPPEWAMGPLAEP